ncbi:LamG domain-containing protein, partial [archaeon]|nr:LamG domain-containing protein [archaeon]
MKRVIILFLFASLVSATPTLTFLPPTNPDGFDTTNSWTEINVSLNESSPIAFDLDMDELVYPFYSDSLVFSLSLDNNPSIGESPTFFVDVSKQGNNCTCSGSRCPSTTTGKYGGALNFDGSDDRVDCSNVVFNLIDEITLEAWIQAEQDNEGAILHKWQWGDESSWSGFHFGLGGGNLQIVLGHGDGTGTQLNTDFTEYYGKWTHVAATGEPGKLRIFINGERLDKIVMEKDHVLTNTRDLRVGGGSGFSGKYFEGKIDEAKIHNKAFSPEDIKKRFQSYVKKNNSTHWEFYNNFTMLTDGIHSYYVSATNVSGSSGSTETRTINVDLVQSITGNLDASGFAGEASEWEYSPFLENPEGIEGSSNDSRISWDGTLATFDYSTPGDYPVEITFIPAFGETFSGTARIRIVERLPWRDFHTFMWSKPVMTDGRDGDVNEEKTAQAVADLGAEAVTVGLNSEKRYNYFISMLEQGVGSDLKVWARLPPHCEDWYGGKCYPYEDDYVAWAEHLANLSLQYPQLEAWTVDDMHPHSTKFSSDYVNNMTLAAKRINPNLHFIPTWYFHMEGDLMDYEEWEEVIDQTFMWYWASYQGTPDLNDLQNHLNQANQYIPPSTFITGIYPMKEADEQYDEQFTIDMLEMAIAQSNGIAVYDVHLWAHNLSYFYNATIFRQQTNNDPSFDHRLASKGCRGTYIGWYQAIEQNISLPPTVDSASISFKVRDSKSIGTTLGYHYKQLVVGGDVLWDVDIVTDGTGTETITRDITSYLQGDTSNIVLRMYDKKAVGCFDASVYLGDIVLTVNEETIENNWIFMSTIENISRFTETYTLVKGVLFEQEDPCGNGVCDSGETHLNCPQDCPSDDNGNNNNGGNGGGGGGDSGGGGGGDEGTPTNKYNVTFNLSQIEQDEIKEIIESEQIKSALADNGYDTNAEDFSSALAETTRNMYQDCMAYMEVHRPTPETTQIDVSIECDKGTLNDLVVIVDIPKTFAETTDNIIVTTDPTAEVTVLEEDPLYSFYHSDLPNGKAVYTFNTQEIINRDNVVSIWKQPWFFQKPILEKASICGDGVLDEGEECDTTAP